MKGHGNTQAGNCVADPEWAGVTMKTDSDTTSRDNFQTGNVVTGVVDREGAYRMFGRGLSINNQCDTTATDQMNGTEGGWAYFQTNSGTQGPLVISGIFKAPRGIKCTAQGDLKIDVHLTSDEAGIDVQHFSSGRMGTVEISGSVTCPGAPIYVGIARRLDLHDFEFRTNLSGAGENAVFANTEERTTIRNISGVITDTEADSAALGYVFSLFAEDDGALGQTNHMSSLESVNLITFRPLSYFSRSLAATNLIGDTKVSLSEIDIDLQGEACTAILRVQTNTRYASLRGVRVVGTPTRTVDGGGITVADLIIEGGLMNYAATDNLAGHTNATATRSRIGDNKTA